jgi:hypothetical protein
VQRYRVGGERGLRIDNERQRIDIDLESRDGLSGDIRIYSGNSGHRVTDHSDAVAAKHGLVRGVVAEAIYAWHISCCNDPNDAWDGRCLTRVNRPNSSMSHRTAPHTANKRVSWSQVGQKPFSAIQFPAHIWPLGEGSPKFR